MISKAHQFQLLHDQTDMSIAKLARPVELPTTPNHLYSLSITNDEISLVAPTTFVESFPSLVTHQNTSWQTLKIDHTLDFSMVGVIAQLSQSLAQQSISVFVISTYNTDYLLVKKEQIEKTLTLLRQQGHSVETVAKF